MYHNTFYTQDKYQNLTTMNCNDSRGITLIIDLLLPQPKVA